MPRSPTPLHKAVCNRMPAVRSVLEVSGTVTVLFVATLVRPAAIEAQAIGTMQVVARVTPADAAWDGLASAQRAAREFAAAPNLSRPRRTDHSLTQTEVVPVIPPQGDRPLLVVSIHYLRN